jgi:hypothetical protein
MHSDTVRDAILRPIVVPFILCHHLMFQHDNARPNIARICTQFLETVNVPVILWPAYSPDISPIKHVWDALDRCVQQCIPVPLNSQQLHTALKRSRTTFHRPKSTAWSTIRRRCAVWGKWWSHQILTGYLIHDPNYFLRYLWPTDAYLYS